MPVVCPRCLHAHIRKALCCEAPSTLETINASWAYLMSRIRDARTHRKICRAKTFQPGVQVRQVTLVPETTFQHCLAFSNTSWKKLQLAFKQNTANGSWNTKHGCSIELKFKHGMFPCPLHQLKTLELEMVYTCFFNNQDLHVPHPGLNELQLRKHITFIMHSLPVDGNKCRRKWYKNKNGRKSCLSLYIIGHVPFGVLMKEDVFPWTKTKLDHVLRKRE